MYVCSEELRQLLTAGERSQVHNWPRLDVREEIFNDTALLTLVLPVVSTGSCQRPCGLLAPLPTLTTTEKIRNTSQHLHMK